MVNKRSPPQSIQIFALSRDALRCCGKYHVVQQQVAFMSKDDTVCFTYYKFQDNSFTRDPFLKDGYL